MSLVSRLFGRFRDLLAWKNRDRDIHQEMQFHLESLTQEHIAAGMSAEEAQQAAQRRFGGILRMKERGHDVRGARLLDELSQDVRYAWRGMRGAPGFSLGVVSMLGIGLALVCGGYAILNGVFYRTWPVPDADQVFVVVAERSRIPNEGGVVSDGLSLAAYMEIRRHATAAQYAALRSTVAQVGVSPADDDRADFRRPRALYVSDNFVDTLGIRMQRGTGNLGGNPGEPPRIVISERAWQTIFAGDPDIVGRTVWIGRVPAIVSGVMAAGVDGVGGGPATSVLVGVQSAARIAGSGTDMAREDACCLSVIGRLRPGRTLAHAASELDAIVAAYRRSIGSPNLLVSLQDTTLASELGRFGSWNAFVIPAISLMGMAFVLILFLTCANTGNLFLARSFRREREIVTRLAIGASRARIVRQLVTEGLVLASVAGTAAYVVTASIPTLMARLEAGLPEQRFAADWRVAVFTACATVITCLIVSLAPALQLTRVAWRGMTPTRAPRSGGLRGSLLAVQIATATALVLGSVLLARGVVHAAVGQKDFALHTTAIVTIRDTMDDTGRRESLRARLLQATRESNLTLGVTDASLTGSLLGNPTFVRREHSDVQFRVKQVSLSMAAIGVLEIQLAAGRWMADNPASAEVVVNETLARRMWPHASSLGQTLLAHRRPYLVVGVARDAHLTSLSEIEPVIHVAPSTGWPALVVRMAPNIEPQLAAFIHTVDPALGMSVAPMSGMVTTSLRDPLTFAAIGGGLAVTALVLAVIGTFGVFAYLVEERRREMGIRIALGASRAHVGRALFRVMRRPVAGGLAGGLLLAGILSVMLRQFLFGLSPLDPLSYVAVAAVLALAALVAAAVPVSRAFRINPATTLKAE